MGVEWENQQMAVKSKRKSLFFHRLKATRPQISLFVSLLRVFVCLFFPKTEASPQGALLPSPAAPSSVPLAQRRAHFYYNYHCFHSGTSKDLSPGQWPSSSQQISPERNQGLLVWASSSGLELTFCHLFCFHAELTPSWRNRNNSFTAQNPSVCVWYYNHIKLMRGNTLADVSIWLNGSLLSYCFIQSRRWWSDRLYLQCPHFIRCVDRWQ